MKTGALQCYSQANLGAVLGKTTRQDRGLGTNLLAVRVPWVCVLPIDTRVQREGGALNGFLSETIFAHPRYKGSLFPYTPYQAPSLSPPILLNTLRKIRECLFHCLLCNYTPVNETEVVLSILYYILNTIAYS
jgi:hypothetical protein